MLNQGDDSILIFGDSEEKTEFLSIIRSFEEFNVDIEQGLKFLGNIYFRDSGGLQWCNDLSSYFRGCYIPERSINTLHRPYAMFGLRERRLIYSRHPSFLKARGIEVDLFRQIFRENQMDVENRGLINPKLPSGVVLSSSDLEILQDPEKLFYKYERNDVKDEIYNLFSSDIPKTVNNKLLKYYKEREFNEK